MLGRDAGAVVAHGEFGQVAVPVGVGIALLAVVGLYILGVALVFNVANAVFNTALYHYATSRQVPAGFSPEVLQGAFTQSHA